MPSLAPGLHSHDPLLYDVDRRNADAVWLRRRHLGPAGHLARQAPT